MGNKSENYDFQKGSAVKIQKIKIKHTLFYMNYHHQKYNHRRNQQRFHHHYVRIGFTATNRI